MSDDGMWTHGRVVWTLNVLFGLVAVVTGFISLGLEGSNLIGYMNVTTGTLAFALGCIMLRKSPGA